MSHSDACETVTLCVFLCVLIAHRVSTTKVYALAPGSAQAHHPTSPTPSPGRPTDHTQSGLTGRLHHWHAHASAPSKIAALLTHVMQIGTARAAARNRQHLYNIIYIHIDNTVLYICVCEFSVTIFENIHILLKILYNKMSVKLFENSVMFQ
jgi:hypothetical protein